jgi:hypothetical protein
VERKVYTLKSLALLVVLGAVAFGATFIYSGHLTGSVFVNSAVAQGFEDESNTVIITSDVDAADAKKKVQFEDVVSEDKKIEVDIKEQIQARINKSWDGSIDKMPSLFFTYWQHQSIIDAKNSHGKRRPPTEAELKALEEDRPINYDPERRYVTLGGIVYKADGDWTIWLNGQRVTPDAVPKQVIDLRVFKDYIEVKWLDEYTNSIFPLRLRAHQRFNMDMRIFLPG